MALSSIVSGAHRALSKDPKQRNVSDDLFLEIAAKSNSRQEFLSNVDDYYKNRQVQTQTADSRLISEEKRLNINRAAKKKIGRAQGVGKVGQLGAFAAAAILPVIEQTAVGFINLAVVKSRSASTAAIWNAVGEGVGDAATIGGFALAGTAVLPGIGTAVGALIGAAVTGTKQWLKAAEETVKRELENNERALLRIEVGRISSTGNRPLGGRF